MEALTLTGEPLGCIYTATCTDGTVYVGITIAGYEMRKARHLSNASAGVQYHFYRALRKYGADAFTWSILSEGHTWDELCELERREIAALKERGVRIYNMTSGGDGTPGRTITPESSKRMSDAGKRRFECPKQLEWNRQKSLGVANTPAQKAKISASLSGHTRSAETKARMSAAQKKAWEGRERTPELSRKMSETAKNNPVRSPEMRARISAKMKGVKKGPETVQRMREAQLRRLGKL